MIKIKCPVCKKRIPKLYRDSHKKSHDTPKRKEKRKRDFGLGERKLRSILRSLIRKELKG